MPWPYLLGVSVAGLIAVVAHEYFKHRRLREWLDFHRWAYTKSKDLSVLQQAAQVRDVLGGPPPVGGVKPLRSPFARSRATKHPGSPLAADHRGSPSLTETAQRG